MNNWRNFRIYFQGNIPQTYKHNSRRKILREIFRRIIRVIRRHGGFPREIVGRILGDILEYFFSEFLEISRRTLGNNFLRRIATPLLEVIFGGIFRKKKTVD